MIGRGREGRRRDGDRVIGASDEWFRALVHHSSDVLVVLDASGAVGYASPSVQRVFGAGPDDMVGRTLSFFVRPNDLRRLDDALSTASAAPGAPRTIDCGFWHQAGHWVETEVVVTSLLDSSDVAGVVLAIRDISDRADLQSQLAHQAFHDALTGLANRALFTDRVAHALSVQREGEGVAVLFCDLDGFKSVNDTQGHAVGDQLLGLVAERLLHCLRPSDTCARLGGDEFAILTEGPAAGAMAVAVAERVTETIGQPYLLDGREITVGVSIGIAVAAQPGVTADSLLRDADLAMYRAKAEQPGGWVLFEPHMHDALLDKVQLEADLRHALARHQLVVYYQPTVELATGRIIGAEALLRWHHPLRGVLGPDAFVGIAEDNGVITDIGEWVLHETCAQAARWQRWGEGRPFHIAVNISARQVSPRLVDAVRSALTSSGVAPHTLVLELTETVLMARTEEVLAVLRELKALGVWLAIDDFGTGYSSLSYLSRFPVDILKIDRSFVQKLGDPSAGDSDTELARTILHLGRTLKLATVAEGVETLEHHNTLREMGCVFGQGYLYARPLPPSGLDELLACRVFAEKSRLQRPPTPAETSTTAASPSYQIPAQPPAVGAGLPRTLDLR